MPPQIRLMTISDLPQVMQIDGDSFSDLLTRLYHTTVMLPPHEREYFEFWLARKPQGALVEEENGRINGFIICHERGRSAWIGPLAVRVGAQGRGTGKRLMAAGLKYLDEAGVSLVGLDTFAQNPVSVSLYLKCGFQLVGGLILMEAPCASLNALWNVEPQGLKVAQASLSDLPQIARMELEATGFDRLIDFQFYHTSGLGAVYAAWDGEGIVGYAVPNIRRRSGFISSLHIAPRGQAQVIAPALLRQSAQWLRARGNDIALVFCRGDELRMHRLLTELGFRMRSMCVTMHRTGAVGKGPIRTPFSIEKG